MPIERNFCYIFSGHFTIKKTRRLICNLKKYFKLKKYFLNLCF